jgi:hypothetical protein
MKRNLMVAVAMFTFTLAGASLQAHAADSGSTTVTAQSAEKGASTDEKHKDWADVVTTIVSVVTTLIL